MILPLGLVVIGLALPDLRNDPFAKADSPPTASDALQHPTNVAEARGRAKLLHETLHGALQVMHRDFFREDEKMPIPSQSLEDVFKEVERTQQVKLRWLAVNTDAMNVDHKPKSDFEKQAVKALASGEEFYESTQGDYQYAGKIRLSASCLGCHLPSRGSNKDRAAALVISIPAKKLAR
jgi:hypothetical protein